MDVLTNRVTQLRRVTAVKVLLVTGAIAAAASVVCFGVALHELRSLPDWDHLDIGAGEIAWTRHGSQRYGTMDAGLPPWNLHLDGRPPTARLVAVRTGDVVAPPVLRRSTLDANRRGVLWTHADAFANTRNRVEIVVDDDALRLHHGDVALRFEVPRSRRTFFVSFVLGWCLAIIGIVGALVVRWLRADARDRNARAIAIGTFFWLTTAATLSGAMFFPDPPWLLRDSDGSSIDAFAAALDAPSTFTHDPLLGNRAHFDWYTPVYVTMVRAIHRTGLPYYSTRAVLGFASAVIGLAGFFLLFRRISGSALFAVAAASALWLLHDVYPPNEQWSPSMVLPRSVFTSLSPWVVLLMLHYRKRPARWWLVGIASGILVYIHPVSAPALTGAVCLGFLVGGHGSLRRRAPWAVLAGASALVVMGPFASTYLSKGVSSSDTTPPVRSVPMRDAFPTFHPLTVLVESGALVVERGRYWLALGALLFLYRRRERMDDAPLYAGFVAGYAVVAIGIPVLDWTMATLLDRPLFQVDLVRNLRYLEVLLLGVFSLVVFELGRTWRGTIAFSVAIGDGARRTFAQLSRASIAATLVLAAVYAPAVLDGLRSASSRLEQNARMLRGRPSDVPLARLELLTVVRSIRREHQVVAVPDDLDFARELGIPLAYIWKDPGTLSYTDAAQAAGAATVLEKTTALLDPPITYEQARRAAGWFDVSLMVLMRSDVAGDIEVRPEVIFRNERYVLLCLSAAEDCTGCHCMENEHGRATG